MSLQSLIDELRRELPGCTAVSITGYSGGSDGGRLEAFDPEENGGTGQWHLVQYGPRHDCKTPCQALSLLKQRLGIGEGES